MENPCQYCGTSISIPEKGTLIVKSLDNKASSLYRTLLEVESQGTNHLFQYESLQELKGVAATLVEDGLEEQLVSLKSATSTQPILVQHLYERLTYPEMTATIEEGWFTTHLQPIVHLSDHSIFGYEALLRPTHYEINPMQLFSFAQRAGLHSMLDQKAREEAVKKKAELIPKGQKCFINFLPSTIYAPEHCLSHTFSIVNRYNVNPAELVFEVVETEAIDDVDHLKRILRTYQTFGMEVALDDVGAGFSTLERLSLLTPQLVKIDRSFITDCHQDESKQQFLKEVIDIANQLEISVLGEGIETKEEYEWLKQLGVHYAQGYYIGKPSPYLMEAIATQ
ncbi:hypothetical protein N781_09220 [Pontibacillus halophilus JSM 076056 = DSM 19796]|uniref:EAL domain-containing protein n=1 Tax=Pontibacillus halophilus JSM 076056 = DSM 19796 TaxID=1385510 RepID=A0A0A5G8F7_9BACI|nr:EAL domain-containing protein [Pontibacillus halophilus]KGX89421.1 hypothetical protein N781_09220 [Pontibacillus halophilus JSM 076056 = DSM 19796]